ncbi:hypothetical protein GPECTOR_842g80 [Gonium pectorale]|uniref:phytol kinase n=1 Tax=Gonium pectorale TaxID=33097 RepID=A0A150FV59_GONPE|nr:hypothetical protein GPECTOR_842g80 [Gonium pectorale]|eukprot:KXZ41075.1 hypothetical protein GPECTOR_842g80 [Gonium pectorale]
MTSFVTRVFSTPAAALGLVADKATCLALLRVLAESLRLDGTHTDGPRQQLCAEIANSALGGFIPCLALVAENLRIRAAPMGPLRRFLLALLRSGAFHAAARRLAALAALFDGALEEAGPAAAGDALAAEAAPSAPVHTATALQDLTDGAPDAATVHSAVSHIAGVHCVVQAVYHCAAPKPPSAWQPEARQLCEELMAALEGSQVLEHAARLLLLLLPRAGAGAEEASLRPGSAALSAARAYTAMADLHGLVGRWGLRFSPACTPHVVRLAAAVSGPCVQHAAVCMALAQLRAEGGGPAYGLPPALLSAMPVDPCVTPRGSGSSRPADLPFASTRPWTDYLPSAPLILRLGDTKHVGRRGSWTLLKRLGWHAVVKVRALAAEAEASGRDRSGGGSSSSAQREGPPSMAAASQMRDTNTTYELMCAVRQAFHVVRCTARFCPSAPDPPTPSGPWAAEVAELWRLLTAVTRDVLPHGADNFSWDSLHVQLIGPAGALELEGGAVFPPVEPPPLIAAALDGGMLRCQELLLRRAGKAPRGQEASAVRYQATGLGVWRYLAPLLAYGEPRQAAALVATLRKLLRTCDPRVLPLPWEWEHVTSQCIAAVACGVLGVAGGEGRLASLPVGGPSPAGQQLLRLLSFAACEWLPELSRLVHQALLLPGTRWHTPISLDLLLKWMPLLAGRCMAQSQGPVDTDPPEEEAGGGDAAADAGGWRALLLEEMGAVTLLGAALELPGRAVELEVTDDPAFQVRLVAACSAVAAIVSPACGLREQQAAGPAGPGPGGNTPSAAGGHVRARSAVCSRGATAVAATAPPPLPWRPEALRAVAAHLQCYGEDESAREAEGLAAWLEHGCVGSPPLPPLPGPGSPLAALPAPAEVRSLSLLRTCANPACANLEGDSEADLKLLSCGGCGEVGYCCRPCQTAHWRAGHKGECAGGRAQRGGGG